MNSIQNVMVACFLSPVVALANGACGKDGWWEGVHSEVAFSNRLGQALPSYIKVPTQEWLTRLGNKNEGKVGSAVCARDANRLRAGQVNTEFIYSYPADQRIEAARIMNECRVKEKELTALSPDRLAKIDDQKALTRQILGNKGAMASLTPEQAKARQDLVIFQNKMFEEQRKEMAQPLESLFVECNARRSVVSKDVRYTVSIQVNPSGTPRDDAQTKPLYDLGDKSIRSGPSDRVRRILILVTGIKNTERTGADLSALQSFIDLPRLQALIDGGGQLPSAEELVPIKAAQQINQQEQEKWSREQIRLESQAEREKRNQKKQ